MDEYTKNQYKNAKSPFEEFLKEQHAYDYIGTDDDMSDDFDKWLEEMDIDSWIDYGDKFAKLLLRLIK